MDVQTGLIYVAVVVISALVIGFVSVFAMKEKSYEEAIAEQRKLPDDLLLGKKDKSKEKKHKNKMGKKVKEKKEDKEEKEEKPEHVQFEETPQILPPEPSLQENGKSSKKKGKAEKVKPILVNKDEPVAVINEPTPLQSTPSQESNHFDVTQPKDDLELIKSQSRENLHQISQSETAVNKSPKETPTKAKKNAKEKDSKKKDEHKEEKKETPANGPQVSKENLKEVKEKPKESLKEQKEQKEPKEQKEAVKETVVPLQSSVNKESKKIKKKKDNDIYLAQFGGDRDSVNFSCLDKLVQNAELSRSEIQFLIEKLLNKQQDSPQELAEWTESRADPTIKLKKQLADAEKSLSIEREKNDSMQKKLMGLRTELNSDKQRLRQLEEKANEVQHLRNHIQSILDSHIIEKQEASRRIEELDAKINEDAIVIQKLQEDQGQLQALQQELDTLQKQTAIQLENENSLKLQLEEKHIELQQTCDSSNRELEFLKSKARQAEIELKQTCESSNRELEFLKSKVRQAESQLQEMRRRFEESAQTCSEIENKLSVTLRAEQELKDQLNYFQNELKTAQAEANKVASLNEQISTLQTELAKQKAEFSASSIENTTVQLNELRSQLNMREQKLQQALSEINNLTSDISKVRSELKSNQAELAKIQEDYKTSQNELTACQKELRETLKSLTQTRAELSKLKQQEENQILTARVEEIADLQKQIQQLKEKNESLTSQLAIKERSTVDGRENGIEEKVQKNNIQIDESINLLAQKEDQLKSLRSQVESLRSQINDQRNISSRLQDDLEQQRSKNNDLRRKNWKVMEALNSAESRLKNNFGLNDDVRKLKTEEQDATKALLQRIFPEIKVTEKSHDQWIKVFEEQVHKTLNKLKTDTKTEDTYSELEKANKNLQAMVNHYKQIIDDTEGMLNKLQSHIESEEKRWQAQLRQKETEVSNLRLEIHSLQNKTTNNNNELQQKVAELESRLLEKESLKVAGMKSEVQLNRVESRVPDFSVVEKLQQENVRLSQQLQSEISKQAGLASQVAELRALAESTESSLTEEKRKNDLLQKEMSQLKTEVCGGSSSSDQSTLNGPPASDSPKSEPTLGTQCLIAALEQTLLKNSELENCSLTEPNNSAESPQDNDESSPTSKIASDYCNTTDKVLQNSCNPLNGQQHKKHKKKRKGGSGKK